MCKCCLLTDPNVKLPSLDFNVRHIRVWKYAAIVELTTTFPATIKLQAIEIDEKTKTETPRGAPVEKYVPRGSEEHFYIQPLTPDTPFYIAVSATDSITGKLFPISRDSIKVDDHGVALRTLGVNVPEPQAQFVQSRATYNSDSGQVNFSIKADNVQQVLAVIYTSNGVRKQGYQISVSQADWYNKKDISIPVELSAGQYDVRLWALNQADEVSTDPMRAAAADPTRAAVANLPLTVSSDPIAQSVTVSFSRDSISFKATTETEATMTVVVGDLEKKASKEAIKNPEVKVPVDRTAQSAKNLQFTIDVKAADGSRRSFHESLTLGVNDLDATNPDVKKGLTDAANAVNTGKVMPKGEFWKSGLGIIIRFMAQALIPL